jgi:uncharacterized protein YehS (DUF1456 family)
MENKHFNNQVLKGLKAAHKFTDSQIYEIWKLGGVNEFSRSSSVYPFKGINYKNYRICTNEQLLAFIDGLIKFFSKSKD